MKNFTSARAPDGCSCFLPRELCTGCKKADAPQFSPSPGTYSQPQLVTMTTPTFGATIVYTDDGSAPSCVKQTGTIYTQPVASSAKTPRCAPWPARCCATRASSPAAAYIIKPPEPVAAPTFSPAAGTTSHAVSQHRDGHRRCDDSLHERRHPPRPAPAARCTPARSKSRSTVTLNAIALRDRRNRQRRDQAAYVITPPAAAPAFDPRAGRIHQRAARHADFRDSRRHVPLHHRRR